MPRHKGLKKLPSDSMVFLFVLPPPQSPSIQETASEIEIEIALYSELFSHLVYLIGILVNLYLSTLHQPRLLPGLHNLLYLACTLVEKEFFCVK